MDNNTETEPLTDPTCTCCGFDLNAQVDGCSDMCEECMEAEAEEEEAQRFQAHVTRRARVLGRELEAMQLRMEQMAAELGRMGLKGDESALERAADVLADTVVSLVC